MITYVAPPAVAGLARSLFITKCHNTAILALLVWDFGLLFGDEVKYIWMRQRSLFSLFWFLLRYPIILSHVFVVVAFSSHGWSPELYVFFCSCVRWTQAKTFLMWVSLFSSRLCWCLRTYALWNRQRWLAMVGLPIIIMESTIVLFATMNIRYIPMPHRLDQICLASPGTGLWAILAWVVPFSFDTAMSSLSIVRAMRVSLKLKTPLTKQLIRDGFCYYGLMTAIYVMALVLYWLDPMRLFIMAHMLIGLLGIISARFLLNLRMLKTEDEEYKSQQQAADPACADDTVSYGPSFGILTGVEGFMDQFELDDARKGRDVSISMQRGTLGVSRTSRTPLPVGWQM